MKVEFFKHNIDEADIKRVEGVLRSLFLTTASVTQSFEEQLAQYLGCAHVVAVNSCTAALHLALMALDLKEGDEVITTPMSFIATSNAILHAGGKPVFVDIEPETGNMDIAKVEYAITHRTKAILPVHLYGNMVDMRKLRALADEHGLYIIEDAAHCIEGVRDGVKVGELGDMACFSFYATKNITSGEGGAISCHHEALAERLKCLRLHGMSKDASSRYGTRYKHWDMVEIGWKYNISDIQSALLVGQLEKIDTFREKREHIAHYYEQRFEQQGISFVKPSNDIVSARHLFVIHTLRRNEVISDLNYAGIGVAVNYNPIHLTHYYKKKFSYKEGDFPNAEAFGSGVISIPLYPKLTKEEIVYVADNVIKSVKVEL